MKSKSDLVDIYKKVLTGDFQGWTLFQHGTCVVIPRITQNLQLDAITLLRLHGQVIPGTPLADFNITPLKDDLGWVITGNHPDILNFVSVDEVKDKKNEVEIGLLGRNKKELDAKELTVIHEEKNKPLI